MEKFFQLKANNTTVRTEVIAGITTFLTMAYILAVTRAFCPPRECLPIRSSPPRQSRR